MARLDSSPNALRQFSVNNLPGLTDEDFKRRSSRIVNDLLQFLQDVDASMYAVPTELLDLNAAAIARLKKVVAARAVRNRLFGTDFFADPAWDIMLDLTIAMAENRQISVSSLCIAANVPTTTALRHIKSLADKGMIIFLNDPKDSRRKHATLSNDMFETMVKFALATMP